MSRLFGCAVSGSDVSNAVQVVLDLPTVEAARSAWNENRDLVGQVTMTLCSPASEPLKLELPSFLPFKLKSSGSYS